MPSSDMWQECKIALQHTRPCYAKSSYRSVDPQTLHGNFHQIDHVPDGPTNSAVTTTMFPLRLCGGKPSVAVTRERRYGPSRLRVNDDDDDIHRPSRTHARTDKQTAQADRYTVYASSAFRRIFGCCWRESASRLSSILRRSACPL